MSLKARSVLVVLLAAITPVMALGLWARTTIRDRTKEQYARRLDELVESARRRVEERSRADLRAIGRLCERDFVVDRALLDLEAGRFGPASEQALVQDLPAIMDSLGLDTLELLDDRPEARARVLAAAHFPGRSGARDPSLLEAARRAGAGPFGRTLRLREGGHEREALALLHTCTAERGGVRVVVVGGRFLDTELVEELSARGGIAQLVLADAAGAVPESVGAGGGRAEVHTFQDERGAAMARLVAVVDDTELEVQLAALDRGMFATIGIAVGVALFFGLLLAWSLARPLRDLEAAADRVAGGDLESTMGARSGEVGRVLVAFNRMIRELKHTRGLLLRAERIAAWRDTARMVAHEVKNPLFPMQTAMENLRKAHRLKRPDFDEIFEESTSAFLQEIDRLDGFVTKFSDFARMPDPKPAPLALGELLDHLGTLYQGGATELALKDAGTAPIVQADRGQITQVLVNLVKNAIEATQDAHGGSGGRVRVSLDEDPSGRGARILIEDDGRGIPEEQRAQIFEPYHTTKATGDGLGLSVVARVVGSHGGTVAVDVSPLGGARFTVTLPVHGPSLDATASFTDTALPLGRERD